MEENPLMNFEIIKNIPVKHIIYLVVFSQYCSKNKIQSKYLEKKNGTNFSFKKKKKRQIHVKLKFSIHNNLGHIF